MDGVALLSDALSEDGPVGQAQNLFRLFERAFAKGPSGCVNPLLAFLNCGEPNLDWSQEEVANWFNKLRAEIAHADRRESFARAPDVVRVIGRMEYAAYDVLLNKAVWRSASSARRDVARLAAGVASDLKTLRIQSPTAEIILPWIDPFGVFPVDFSLHMPEPDGILMRIPDYTGDENSYFSSVQVLREYAGAESSEEFQIVTRHHRVAHAGESESAPDTIKAMRLARSQPEKHRRKRRSHRRHK